MGRCLIQGHVRGGAGGTGAGALPTASALHSPHALHLHLHLHLRNLIPCAHRVRFIKLQPDQPGTGWHDTSGRQETKRRQAASLMAENKLQSNLSALSVHNSMMAVFATTLSSSRSTSGRPRLRWWVHQLRPDFLWPQMSFIAHLTDCVLSSHNSAQLKESKQGMHRCTDALIYPSSLACTMHSTAQHPLSFPGGYLCSTVI